MIRCPECGYSPVEQARYERQTDAPIDVMDELDFFEVGGADEDCVFCPECGLEFNPWGQVLEKPEQKERRGQR